MRNREHLQDNVLHHQVHIFLVVHQLVELQVVEDIFIPPQGNEDLNKVHRCVLNFSDDDSRRNLSNSEFLKF